MAVVTLEADGTTIIKAITGTEYIDAHYLAEAIIKAIAAYDAACPNTRHGKSIADMVLRGLPRKQFGLKEL